MGIENLLIKKCIQIIDRIELRKKKNENNRFIKQKLISGLTDEDRLSPCDSKCNSLLIKDVQILSMDNCNDYKLIKQLVTYIDDSKKEFNIQVKLLVK